MKRKLKKILCMSLVAVLCINHVTVAKQETVTAKSKENIKIAIDAGHQARGNSATEPIGPGSSTTGHCYQRRRLDRRRLVQNYKITSSRRIVISLCRKPKEKNNEEACYI